MHRTLRVASFVVIVSGLVGCGKDPEPTGPKTTLTEQEKKQVQDLNKQRQEEWSSTTKAKK